MDKIARLLVTRVNGLQQNLESLLDLDQWSPPKQKNEFEIKTDLTDLLKSCFENKKNEDLFISLLSCLSPYFDSGLLLYRKEFAQNKETWVHGAAFHEGVYFHIPNELAHLKLTLPALQKLELKKCAPYHLLSPLGLTDLCDHSDSSAFIFKIHESYALAVMTKLPEPWLRMHMEKIHNFIEKLISNQKHL